MILAPSTPRPSAEAPLNAAATAQAESALSQIQKPTALSAGLQIGSAAAAGWADIEKAKIGKPKKQKAG